MAETQRYNIDVSAKDLFSGVFNSLKGAISSTTSAVTGLQGALAGLGVSIGVGAFAAMIKNAIDAGDALNKMSQRTGIAVETLDGLSYAAKLSDVSMETLAKGLKALSVNAVEAAAGNKEALSVFQKMGLSVKDAAGNIKPLNQLLEEQADRFASYKDGPEKAALAVKQFGKAGMELIPMLNMGAEAIRKLREEQEKYGGITADTARRSEAFNDTVTKLQMMGGAFARTLAAELLPSLQSIVSQFVEMKEKGTGAWGGFIESAKTALEYVDKLLRGIKMVKELGGGDAAQGMEDLISGPSGNLDEKISKLNEQMAQLHAQGVKLNEEYRDAKGPMANAAWNAQARMLDVEIARVQRLLDLYNGIQAGKKSDAFAAMAGGQGQSARAPQTTAPNVGNDGGKADKELAEFQRMLAADFKASADALLKYEDAWAKLRATAFPFEAEAAREAAQLAILNKAFMEGRVEMDAALQIRSAIIMQSPEWKRSYAEAAKAIKDEEDALRAVYDLRKQAIRQGVQETESMIEYADSLEAENKLLGLNTREREKMIIQMKAEAAIKKPGADPAAIEAASARAQAAIDTRENFHEQMDLWRQVDDTAHDVFVSIAEGGTAAFRDIGQALKRWVLDLLYQITIKRWIIGISGMVGGAGSAMAGGVAESATGGMGNMLLSGASSFLSGGLGSLPFVAGAGPIAAGTGLAGFLVEAGMPVAGSFVAGMGAPLATLSSAMTGGVGAAGGLAAVAGAAVPIIGAALAIAYMAGAFGKKGGPKTGGFAQSAGMGLTPFFTETAANADLAKLVTGAGASYEQLVRGFGGRPGDFQFALGFDSDPQGTAANRISAGASVNGVSVMRQRIAEEIGRDQATLEKAIGDVVGEALKGALMASDIPQAVKDLLEPFSGTAAEIEAYAQKLVGVNSLLRTTNVGLQQILTGLSLANLESFTDKFGGVEATIEQLTAYIGQFYSAQEQMAIAGETLVGNFAALGQAMPESKLAFRQMLESIDLTTESGQDLYASLIKLSPAFASFINSVDELGTTMRSQTLQFANTRDSLTGGTANRGQALTSILAAQVDQFVAGNPLFQSLYDTGGRFGVANYLTNSLSYGDFQGASAEDQARILNIQGTRLAIADLDQATSAAIPSIYSAAEAVGDFATAMEAAAAQFRGTLTDWLDSLLLNKSLSTLSPERMLAEAKSQYLTALGSGDAGKITGAGNEYLGLARDFYGSSPGYNAIFDTVRSQVSGVAAGQSVSEILMDSVTVQTQIRDGVNRLVAATEKTADETYSDWQTWLAAQRN